MNFYDFLVDTNDKESLVNNNVYKITYSPISPKYSYKA